MEKIITTKSGVDIFQDEDSLCVKGDSQVAIKDLKKDLEDPTLPFEVRNVCTIVLTLLASGAYKSVS